VPTGSTVDPQEVVYYERLADLWWDEAGPFWPLHRLNQLRIGYIRERLSRHFGRDREAPDPLSGLRILDIGCGGGLLSEAVARLGAAVHGVDVVEKNIRIARLHGERNGLDIAYETSTAEELAEREQTYDAVLNMEVLEHVGDLPLFVRACGRLVRPGGVMVVATLTRTLVSWLGAIVIGEYVLGWLPKGTHQWKKFPKPQELKRLLAPVGLTVTDEIGVRINPFTRRFSLTRYMGVNYLLIAQKTVASKKSSGLGPPGRQGNRDMPSIGPDGPVEFRPWRDRAGPGRTRVELEPRERF
jgi:2-polyprenyl-6-hydroxyphenyl methylase/3-demethylubiquinone-9 3-methyltransferase